QFAINKGYADITVVSDIENSESFTVADGQDVTVTLLEGVTIEGSGYDGVFYVENGTLTLNGDGTIVGKLDREYSMAVWAFSENAKVVINGNTFTNEGYPEDDQFDMIYAKENAVIEINGGTFECYTPYWTLNLRDKSGANIVVSGGKFYQYDPSNSDTENPRANFVADGYESILVGDFYTVVEVNHATQAQINALAKTFADANEGDTIYLDALHYGCLSLGSGAYAYDYPANLTIVGTEGTYFTGISISDEVIAGWTFKNITFIGNPNDNAGNADGITVSTKATISDLTVDNCAFINGANFGMINTKNPFECYDTVTIKNCLFDRVAEGSPAILLQGVKDATVENCVFNNAGYNAVQTNKSTGTVTIKDNYIYLTEDRALRIANQGANIIISGNEIISEGDVDGELFKSSGTNGTITLEGNTWNGQTDDEVVISNASAYVIKNA
ncbi:MAG: right-handed parallel beta-helix repeat-containing protein, partial [Clostridia bacterium]|nr:right-handed parallel beta-helix repeat-containing protein [Clostridia bacterium]